MVWGLAIVDSLSACGFRSTGAGAAQADAADAANISDGAGPSYQDTVDLTGGTRQPASTRKRRSPGRRHQREQSPAYRRYTGKGARAWARVVNGRVAGWGRYVVYGKPCTAPIASFSKLACESCSRPPR